MTRETLFIADLHLDHARPAVTELFIDFLERRAPKAEALYILGDLFEAWIGDDDDDPDYDRVCRALRTFSDGGTPLYIMRGNRDFLMGSGLEARTGAHLLPDPTVIELYGQRVLLSHGDLLCTDDVAHQRFRAMVDEPQWRAEFLARPLPERRAMAVSTRHQSQENVRTKSAAIMDVNAEAVERCMREHRVSRMIHGHTHRPDVHELSVDGQPAVRVVLGDWFDQGSVLIWRPGAFDLVRLNRADLAAP